MKYFIKKHLIGIFWTICIVLSLAFISIIWYQTVVGNMQPLIFQNAAITFVIITVIVLRLFFFRRLWANSVLNYIIITVVLFLIFWYSSCNNILYEFVENNIGGFFIITIGFVSTLIAYLGFQLSLEMTQTITSYPQLMKRLTELINDTSSEEIRMVSYFVLPGYWQVKNKWIRKRFRDALVTNSHKLNIVSITPNEHLSLLIDIAKKGTSRFPNGANEKEIIEFYEDCENILSKLEPNKSERLTWNKMPSYYFFLFDERAIIVTPVGLPKLNDAICLNETNVITDKIKNSTNASEDGNIIKDILTILNNLQKPKSNIEAKIVTLGFETTDQNIINMLWEEFNKITGKQLQE